MLSERRAARAAAPLPVLKPTTIAKPTSATKPTKIVKKTTATKTAKQTRARRSATARVLDKPTVTVVATVTSLDERRRSDRCDSCNDRRHGMCTGGDCDCPVIRCNGKSWRKEAK